MHNLCCRLKLTDAWRRRWQRLQRVHLCVSWTRLGISLNWTVDRVLRIDENMCFVRSSVGRVWADIAHQVQQQLRLKLSPALCHTPLAMECCHSKLFDGAPEMVGRSLSFCLGGRAIQQCVFVTVERHRLWTVDRDLVDASGQDRISLEMNFVYAVPKGRN